MWEYDYDAGARPITAPTADTPPPDDHDANRAEGYSTPPSGPGTRRAAIAAVTIHHHDLRDDLRDGIPATKKNGKKSRSGRSSKVLQPANRG